MEGSNVMLFAPTGYEYRACQFHQLVFNNEINARPGTACNVLLPKQKARRCTHIGNENERHAFCARTIVDGRACGLRMSIDAKIAFCFINKPLLNSRRRLQFVENDHPLPVGQPNDIIVKDV